MPMESYPDHTRRLAKSEADIVMLRLRETLGAEAGDTSKVGHMVREGVWDSWRITVPADPATRGCLNDGDKEWEVTRGDLVVTWFCYGIRVSVDVVIAGKRRRVGEYEPHRDMLRTDAGPWWGEIAAFVDSIPGLYRDARERKLLIRAAAERTESERREMEKLAAIRAYEAQRSR